MSDSLVDRTYVDAFDRVRTVAPEVRASVIAALGPDRDAAAAAAVVGRGGDLPGRCRLRTIFSLCSPLSWRR